jgi:hypothetical protein
VTEVPADPTADDPAAELAYWHALAEERGKVIRALHEFNYWHESTVARGEVVAGLEKSVELWRERCLAAEARLADPASSTSASAGAAALVRRGVRLARRTLRNR